MLLRIVIERVTGSSFGEVVRRETGLDVAESLAAMARLTPGHSGDPMENIIPTYHPGWVSHGLVVATALQTAMFVEQLFDGDIVTQRSLAEMLVAIPVGETHPWMKTPSYGEGLMIDPDNRFGLVAGHTGGGPGYSTAAYHLPDVAGRRVTVVALVNADHGDTATAIVFSLAEALAAKD